MAAAAGACVCGREGLQGVGKQGEPALQLEISTSREQGSALAQPSSLFTLLFDMPPLERQVQEPEKSAFRVDWGRGGDMGCMIFILDMWKYQRGDNQGSLQTNPG